MDLRSARLGILAVAAVGCLWGCRLTPEFRPQPVSIKGNSYNPGIAVQIIPPLEPGADWSSVKIPVGGTISASGDAEPPALALDPVQGRLVAKQMARQVARRNLARKVEATEVRPGLTIGDAIRDDAQKRQRLEEVLRKASQKGVITGEGGKCTVFLSIDFPALNRVFLATEASDDSTSLAVVDVSPERFRKRAENEALENARVRTLEYLKGLIIAQNETLGMRMLRDDKLNRTIRQMVENLRPVGGVKSREDGSCEVTVQIDMAEIQRLVVPRRFRLKSLIKLEWLKRGLPWRRRG